MEFGCPVCNGFTSISKDCPCCHGELLEDRGALEDFYGPYSPYDFKEFYDPPQAAGPETDRCTHLLSCPACGYDERIRVCRIVM
jgi:hypothetical protein